MTMDVTALLAIIQMTTALAGGLAGEDSAAKTGLEISLQLEAIAAKVAEAHQTLVGQPINPDSLKYEPPV
jgi:hypothetical protein